MNMSVFSKKSILIIGVLLAQPFLLFLVLLLVGPMYRVIVTQGIPVRNLIILAFVWHILGSLFFTMGIILIIFFKKKQPNENRTRSILAKILTSLEIVLVILPVMAIILIGPYLYFFLVWLGH